MRPPTPTRRATRLALAGAGAAAAYLGLAGDTAGAAAPIQATFRAGVLTVDGTAGADTIVVGANAAGRLVVNDGAVAISGPTPTTANTTLISVDGRNGADTIRLVDPPTGLPRAELIGGGGADTLTGGVGPQVLAGGPGADTLVGRQGDDVVEGGAGTDTVTWAPGEGNDTIDGGDADRLSFAGANVAERLALRAQPDGSVLLTRDVATIVLGLDAVESVDIGTRIGVDSLAVDDLGPTDLRRLALDLGSGPGDTRPDGQADTVTVAGGATADTVRVHDGAAPAPLPATGLDLVVTGGGDATDALRIDTGSGADSVDAAGLPAGRVAVTTIGGAGDDRLIGHAGVDAMSGGTGVDTVVGGPGADRLGGDDGADVLQGGAGDDVFTWAPGGGDDRIDDSLGRDRLQVAGAPISERFEVQRTGDRLRLTRDVANVVLDAAGLEEIGVAARGGADLVIVGDLKGTTVARVDVDLTVDGTLPDTAADEVVHVGTPGPDLQLVTATGGGAYDITGTGVTVEVVGSAPTADELTVRAAVGDDQLRTSGAVPALVLLEGGDGRDTLTGGPGAEVLLGGNHDDVISAISTSGTDVVDGGAGRDRYTVTGTASAESFVVSALQATTRVTRDLGGRADLAAVEVVEVRPARGRDALRVDDLTGTATTEVVADLEGTSATDAGDREIDRVQVVGTGRDDTAVLTATPGTASLLGLSVRVGATGLDPTDVLHVLVGGGDDVIDAGTVAAGRLLATFDLGTGDDIALGTKGDDTVLAGSGDDVVLAGAGRDAVDGGSGRDVVVDAEVLKNVP